MGFFSFLTADTKESVPACVADHPKAGMPVFLLQPNQQAPLKGIYQGYGRLNDESVYVLFMHMNFGQELSDFSEDTIERVGMMLSDESEILSYQNRLFTCGLWLNKDGVGLINEIRKSQGKGPINIELISDYEWRIKVDGENGELAETSLNTLSEDEGNIKSLREYIDVSHELKFSFDETAKYEDHEKSLQCPHQGYFY